MAPAARSTFFHPEHLVASYHYDRSSTYDCAACKRVVTGTGYRCDKCDFNIHEACFSLPESISFDQHPEHKLTLTRLTASRTCDVCKDTSHEGRYLYRCVLCSFDVHPRCALAQPQQQQQQQEEEEEAAPQGQRSWVSSAFVATIHISLVTCKLVDGMVTGGALTPVIDAIQTAVGNAL